jgi:hypothetical protein
MAIVSHPSPFPQVDAWREQQLRSSDAKLTQATGDDGKEEERILVKTMRQFNLRQRRKQEDRTSSVIDAVYCIARILARGVGGHRSA